MGFLESVFGEEDKLEFEGVPQTAEAIEARKRLSEIARGEPPAVPRRGIAPLPPMTEERRLARETAKELIQPQDFLSLPEVQGIIQETVAQGNLLVNRLGRAQQAAGQITSTTGRDQLGRAVTEIQKSISASLAPFAAEERARRRSLIPTLESLGLTEELMAMGFTQAELDALFQQEFTESQQLQTFTIPILQSIIGLQPAQQPKIEPGRMGILEQISQVLPLLAGIGGGGGAPGAGGVPGGGGFTSPTPTGTYYA